MLAHLILTTLTLGAPDYTKKVMVDPNYKPTRTPQQISKALTRVRKPRVVYRTRTEIVHRTEYRRRRANWVWPVLSFGLYYGTHYALHHNYGRHHYRGYHRYRWR